MCIQRDDVGSAWADYNLPHEVRIVSARVLERLYYSVPEMFNTCGAVQLWRFKSRMELMLQEFAAKEPAAFKQLVDRHHYNTLVIRAHGSTVKRSAGIEVYGVIACMLQEG